MVAVAVLFGTANVGTTLADVGAAVPANEEWSVELIRVANVHATNAGIVDVVITNGTTTVHLAKNVEIAKGKAEDIVTRAFKMPTDWKVRARASAASTLDITVSATKRATA